MRGHYDNGQNPGITDKNSTELWNNLESLKELKKKFLELQDQPNYSNNNTKKY